MPAPIYYELADINGEPRMQEHPALKRTDAERAAGVTPVNYGFAPGNIRRYGAVVNGTTDDAAAFRRALDVAAQDGTTVTCDPPGLIKLGSTIYLPQRLTAAAEYGYRIYLYNCTIIGQGNGVGTIFETGTGTRSTGGASNFSEPAESATSIHWGTFIEGVRFKEYGSALRLFNFIAGCAIRDIYAENGKTLLYGERCFYLTLDNCVGRCTSGASATDAVFHFSAEVNVITIKSCSALCTGGTGWRFDGGVKGLLMNNSTAEQCATGIKFNGGILGAAIRGCYIEGNTTAAIDLGSTAKAALNIDENYFALNTVDVTGDNWQSGELGPGNAYEGGAHISLGGNGNFCRVHLPFGQFPDSGTGDHTTWANLPTGWMLNESIEVVHSDFVYLGATGSQAVLARVEPIQSGSGVVAHKYTGHGGGLVSNFIPFCSTSLQNTDDDLRIDTKIVYNTGASAMFDVRVLDSIGGYTVSGRVVFGNTVYRDDSTGKTVTASDNGGYLRLTIAGFNNITSYNGSVRIV